MLPCTEEEVEAFIYFISNLYLTLYPIRTLSIPFPNFTAVHGVGVAQAKYDTFLPTISVHQNVFRDLVMGCRDC